MGYTTKFKGVLKFKNPVTVEMIAYLNTVLGGEVPDKYNASYCQFEVVKDMTGIEWDGGEKFYYAERAAQFVIDFMREKYPDFGLVGDLKAQGEERDDKWILRCDGATAKKVKLEEVKVCICPQCQHEFKPNITTRHVEKEAADE